jgi:hypothetical protein
MNDYDLENQSRGRNSSSRRPTVLTETGISDPSLLNSCCKVRLVATTNRPWIFLSDLMRSDTAFSMRR